MPKKTAVCTVAGRLVSVRHAMPTDEVFIREIAGRWGVDMSGVEYTRVVVAEDSGKIIGFCFMSESDGGGEFLRVFTSEKGMRGVPELMVKHIMEVERKAG